MSEPTELWIIDRNYEELCCPDCKVDVSTEVLDLCFRLNKKRKWKSQITMRCPYCKKLLLIDVEWIPETAKVSLVEL